MARPLRIEFPGGLYHVTSRGDRREAIYLGDADRQQWLALFAQVCQRYNWACHAYCLMDNHYHIVVETVEGNLSAGMRQLNGVYTQQHNRTHGRVGHVFQGRFKAIIVQREAYLLELARYVVLNPVRAGMCAMPELWPWSSYDATIGKTPLQPWLQTHWLLSQFGGTPAAVTTAYINHARAGIGLPSVWESLQDQLYLGNATFANALRQSTRAPSTLAKSLVSSAAPAPSHWPILLPNPNATSLLPKPMPPAATVSKTSPKPLVCTTPPSAV
jgi:putative transposase